ncbi:phosphatidate cytidylyltransferase [Spirillospora sp. NPDC029432]|uniref:phosphatidate cytidylyltransferase n=1 Tax=Spirillospora sp. NPDC029432 TaxID=3154599 RepID=UPI003453F75E
MTGEPEGSPGEPQAPGPVSGGAAEPGPPPIDPAEPAAAPAEPSAEPPSEPPMESAAPVPPSVAAEEAGMKRGGRNLPIAVGVGVGLGALTLVSLYTRKEIFLAVMVVFLFLGMRELAGAFGTREIRIPLIPLGAGMVAAPVAAYVWGPEALVAALSLIVLTVLVWRMADGPAEGYVRDVAAAVFAAGYLILMGGIVALLMAPDDGDHRIVIFIAVTVASDIGGYFAGTFLGRHKLAPSISPKKTWEGVTGSALTCMLVGAALMWWLLDDGQVWHGVVIGAAAVVTATIGDLIESMLKRDLGIKDMGTLLPEHGGVMDRLDSLVATAPVVWLLLEVFVPSA